MRRDDAEQVVAILRDPAQWDWDDYLRECRDRVDELAVIDRGDGEWAVRLLFHQGPHRMGVETGLLERCSTQEPCTPEECAQELRMFCVEEPHGDQFGNSVDDSGRHWVTE